jgi:hypothetical protein
MILLNLTEPAQKQKNLYIPYTIKRNEGKCRGKRKKKKWIEENI